MDETSSGPGPGEPTDPAWVRDSSDAASDAAGDSASDAASDSDTAVSASDSDVSTSEDEADLDNITERDDITLAESITDEVRRGVYTCMVCTGEIDAESRVWSCHLCYRVYDLDCIRSWAVKGSSTDTADRSWRCPACNNKHFRIPRTYQCWCGKVVDPVTNVLNPHSCSSSCGHKLPHCSHGCSMSCHPGPHLKRCGAMGPVMSCHCGTEERQLPCVMTPYDTGWSCDTVCGDVMPCGVHRCRRRCHTGLCGPCTESVVVRCYCGKHETEMPCSERRPQVSHRDSDIARDTARDSARDMETDATWIGSYACADVCRHPFDCGNHFCDMPCHPQQPALHRCPYNPELATTCPCGKVAITALIDGGRKSCLEPIPVCDNICGKTLPCGHTCVWKCHEGECSPCHRLFTEKCSCNYSQFLVTCAFLQAGNTPRCTHKCQALLNCRRHRCNRICCSEEPTAMRRERTRQKAVRRAQLGASDDDAMYIEAVHFCTRECGKLLACGKHHCQRSCHAGACPPCLESSADDLVCSCGNTVVPAPVRCGTRLPPCPFPCPRVPACGHPRIPHNCHEDDTDCPKCTRPVTRQCQCHRGLFMKNVMCFQEVVSCGMVCGLKLPCGHKCLKTCHKPGECLKKCISKCNAPRSCGHPDLEPCHYPRRECDEKIPCATMVRLSCSCKRITKEIPCGATATRASVKDDVLDCDDECERVERNTRLFEALKISNGPSRAGTSGAYSTAALSEAMIDRLLELENPYPKDILNVFYRQKKWCLGIEKIFRTLVLSKDLSRTTYHFPPMIQKQRAFIHGLAEVYHFYAQSQDQEPRRNVMIQRMPLSKSPNMTLEEASLCAQKLKEREQWRAERGIPNPSEMGVASGEGAYFNAIVVQDVYFGVTRDEIEKATADLVAAKFPVGGMAITYISESTYVMHEPHHSEISSAQAEAKLREFLPELLLRLRAKSLAFGGKLCKLDESGFVIQEVDTASVPVPSPPERSPEPEDQSSGASDEEHDDHEEVAQQSKPTAADTVASIAKDDQWW